MYLLVHHSDAALVYGQSYLVASIHVLELQKSSQQGTVASCIRTAHRKFSSSVQALNFIYTISDAVEKFVKAVLFYNLSRGVQDEHGVRADIMMHL